MTFSKRAILPKPAITPAIQPQHMTLKTLPVDDRPTEKLIRLGVSALSDAELVSIIIRSGTAKETALAVSQRLVDPLSRLLDASIEELQLVAGIGQVRAAQIKAALELGNRAQVASVTTVRQKIRSPEDSIALLESDMKLLGREEFRAIFLDSRHQVIRISAITIGTLNASIVHPRDLFREAIRANSAAIILAHNHPSGDSTPSQEDLATTARFQEIGKLMGIAVIDHIIIAHAGSVSLRQLGLI
ncbi:MAG: DNA repair protein RadC [Eubacteriales bacterium]|nr:DNA repair protein RadC [Eubacteriales bacterium]